MMGDVLPLGGDSSHDEQTRQVTALRTAPGESFAAGTSVSRYVALEQIGRGGMGRVLRAYDPKLQREVALKEVRRDALDDEATARLAAEARAMAKLSHPHVVAVYDVEQLEVGEVVLVMEYVAGRTLKGWLRSEDRSWRAIVDAFIQAGRGLAAAHEVGLLHRDFKPANVLVSERGTVKVTDFGLAKISGSLSHSSSVEMGTSADGLTEAGTVMGTPRYMAPEQHCGESLTPAADQYAFCVALWEGLCGEPPFAGETMAKDKLKGPPAWPERTTPRAAVEASHPADRWRALTGRWPFEGRGKGLLRAKGVGALRWPSEVGVPRHVVDALRRGLSAQPEQRWPSMEVLLAELGRDPSHRRRRLTLIGGVTVVALGAWGAQHIQRARTLAACASEGAAIEAVWYDARAEAIRSAFEATGISYASDTWSRGRPRVDAYADQWAEARRATCERAEVERTMTPELAEASRGCLDEQRQQLDALLQQLEVPDETTIPKAGTATASLPRVRACLDESRLRHRTELPNDPGLRERVRALRSRLSRASAAKAMSQYAAALEDAQAVLEEARGIKWAPLKVEAQLAVADAHDGLGRYEEARAGYEEAFFTAGASAQDEPALRASSSLVSVVGERLARHESGLHWGRVSEMLVERLGLSDDLAVAGLLNNVAAVHHAAGAYEEAEALYVRGLAIREKVLGSDHPDMTASLNNLASLHQVTGSYEEARALYERGLAISEKALGSEHPDVGMSLNNLGNVHAATGRYGEAKASFERSLAIREKALGPRHPYVAMTLNNLALVHQTTGKYEEAIALYERGLAIWEEALGPEHPNVAASFSNLGLVHHARGSYEEAKLLQEQALAIREKALGPEHPDVAASLGNLALVHQATGAYEEARALYERGLAIWEKALGPDHPHVATTFTNLAAVHQATGAYEEARALYERGLAGWEKALGPDHPIVAHALVGLAEVALQQGRADDAVPLAERARALRERSDVPAEEVGEARFVLARVLVAAGRSRAQAVALAVRARDAYREAGDARADALVEVNRWIGAHGGR
jgi:eukaryotic-like serine/threonine-protein kinase